MKTARIPVAVVAALLLSLGIVLSQPEEGQDSPTFSGSYDWVDGGSDELSAEFEPDGENRWKVTFRFRWNGRQNSWKGTAEGSLEDGTTLTGTAKSGGRNWIFDADITDGVMRGKHTEIKSEGREYKTGTFEIER